MSEKRMEAYFELLCNQIVSMFGVPRDQAVFAIHHSAIQQLVRENPEYVDHVPLSNWAKAVYDETLATCRA